MTDPTPEDLQATMTAVADAVAARARLNGYTFVGVVDPEDTNRAWTYSVGMASHGFPDVVLIGLHPHQGRPILDALVNAMLEGTIDPHDPCVYDSDVDLEYSVAFRLRGPVVADAPDWTLPLTRVLPGTDGADGWVVQLLWPDEGGIFPTDAADTITVAGVPIHQHLLPIGPARD